MQLRSTWRQLSRHRGATVAAVVSLALGIGVMTAVQAIVDRTFVRPLPGVLSVERMVAVRDVSGSGAWYSFATFRHVSKRGDLFERVAAFGSLYPDPVVEAEGTRLPASVLMVTPEYFDLLNVHASAGRLFGAAEHEHGAPPVVVLSHAFWRSRFNAALTAIGRDISVGDVQATIIGVAPPGFRGTDLGTDPQLFIPVAQVAHLSPLAYTTWFDEMRGPAWLQIIARRRGDVPEAAGNLAALTIVPGLPRKRTPTSLVAIERAAIPPAMRKDFVAFLTIFSIAAASLLVVASLTVGTLLLATAEQRRSELAVRLALGASRSRLLSEAWVESAALSVLGALLAVPIAHLALAGVSVASAPSGVSLADLDVELNLRVLVTGALIAAAVSVVVTLIAHRVSLRGSLVQTLRGGVTATSTRRRARGVLLLTQASAATALLVGTVLLARSLYAAQHVDVGFDPSNLIDVSVSTLASRARSEDRGSFLDAVEHDVRRGMPGAAVGQYSRSMLSAFGELHLNGVKVQGPPAILSLAVQTLIVSPGYFAVLDLPVIAGRVLSESDAASMPPVAVVNARLARMLRGGQAATESQLADSAFDRPLTIVGVVADVRLAPLEEPPPIIYIARAQSLGLLKRTPASTTILVRTQDAGAVAHLIRGAVASRWPSAIVSVEKAEQRIADAASAQRFAATALGLLTGSVLMLAALSIYVLISSTVTARLRELGIRVALGASRGAIARLVLRDTVLIVVVGLLVGGLSMIRGAALLRSLLFGVTSLDLASFGVAAAVILAVAVIVPIGPVLRATRLDARLFRNV